MRLDRLQLQIERPTVGEPGERIGQGIAHRATQRAAQLAELCRVPAVFALEPANPGP